jgi:hypothetical protein
MRNVLILCLLCVSGRAEILAQDSSGFVVIEFERELFKGHGPESFFWLVSQDSLDSRIVQLAPLYFTGSLFSYDDLTKCGRSEIVNPFLRDSTTNFNFPPGFKDSEAMLLKLVKEYRRQVQRITLKWNRDIGRQANKHTVLVFATPVAGLFYRCSIGTFDRFGYEGPIFLPQGGFRLDESFFGSTRGRRIFDLDYSGFDFISTWDERDKRASHITVKN